MKRIALLCFGAAFLMGCEDAQFPTPPEGAGPLAAIQDGAHPGGGAPFFFFLPPMVADPGLTGAFNPDFLPDLEVRICAGEVDCDTGTDVFVMSFTATTGPGSETLRLGDDHYIVNWHTGDLEVGSYRIHVLFGGAPLGFADVALLSNRSEVRNHAERRRHRSG